MYYMNFEAESFKFGLLYGDSYNVQFSVFSDIQFLARARLRLTCTISTYNEPFQVIFVFI